MKVLIVFLFLISLPAFSSNDPEEEFARTRGGSDIGTGEDDLLCAMNLDGKHVVLPDGSVVPRTWTNLPTCGVEIEFR